ncbi:MAG: hypothetical protein ACRDBM_15815 [Sporomusa sp.]
MLTELSRAQLLERRKNKAEPKKASDKKAEKADKKEVKDAKATKDTKGIFAEEDGEA